eukprot:TRINITY_DN4207_c0_g1_i1.p1 TRINITY_DN4207_c0_g1~~TRINITY_DN4207_c0_g1_i1.p1  ORF type:complete len:1312 (+),score=378.60 TRINITY_DN4207_c0_g1_i1:111-3938(+)
MGGTSDPYVRVYKIHPKKESKIYKSKVINSTLQPLWDETFVFKGELTEELKFEVWDKDVGPTDDFLGQAIYKLSHVGEEETLLLGPRNSKDKNIVGTLTIKVILLTNEDKHSGPVAQINATTNTHSTTNVNASAKTPLASNTPVNASAKTPLASNTPVNASAKTPLASNTPVNASPKTPLLSSQPAAANKETTLNILKSIQSKTNEVIKLGTEVPVSLLEEIDELAKAVLPDVSQDEKAKLFVTSTLYLIKMIHSMVRVLNNLRKSQTTTSNSLKELEQFKNRALNQWTSAMEIWEAASQVTPEVEEKESEESQWKERALAAEAKVQQLEEKIESLMLELEKARKREKALIVESTSINVLPEENELGFLKTKYSSLKILSHQGFHQDYLSPQKTMQEMEDLKSTYSLKFIEEINNWELRDFIDWLRKHNLDNLISVYVSGPGEKGKMFCPRKVSNIVTKELLLEKAPIEEILNILFTTKDSKFFALFDYFQFVQDFITCFRYFISRRKILEYFVKKFNAGDDSDKDRVLIVMQSIAEFGHGEHFRDRKFLEEWNQMCNQFESKSLAHSKKARALKDYPLANPPTAPDLRNAPDLAVIQHALKTILDVPHVELARQITIMTEEKISAVSHLEIIKNHKWSKEGKKDKYRRYSTFNAFNSHISNWLVAQIFKPISTEERAKVISHVIETATELSKMYNFNGAYSFFTVLSYSTTEKLKSSWEIVRLNKKISKQLQSLSWLFDPSRKSANYRDALSRVPPDVPHIPVIAFKYGEIISLNEVTSDYCEEHKGWINWYKMEILARIARSIKGPRPSYCFKQYPMIQKFVIESEGWDINADQGTALIKICKLRESQRNFPNVTLYDTKFLWNPEVMNLRKTDWKSLSSFGRTEDFHKNAEVVRSGEYNICIFQVRQGKVVDKNTKHEWKSGSIFGWTSLFSEDDDHPAESTIMAVEDSKILQIPLPFLIRLYDLNPELAKKMNYTLCVELLNMLKTKRAPAVSDSPQSQHSGLIITPIPTKERNDLSRAGLISSLTKDEMILHQWKCCVNTKRRNLVGTFYATPHYFLFSGKAFGQKKEFVIEIRKIENLQSTQHGDMKITFETKQFPGQLFSIQTIPSSATMDMLKHVFEIWTQVKLRPDDYKKLNVTTDFQNSTWWDELIEGCSVHTFQKGDVIVRQGDITNGRLYLISQGKCQERITFSDGSHSVTEIEEGLMFGESSFLLGDNSASEIIALEENTTISVIEAYFVNILFQHRPVIAGKFYFHLGKMMHKKLNHTPLH